MLSLYVSASRLDQYRKMVQATEDQWWLTEEKFVKSITEREPQGWQARYGEALQGIIENGGKSWSFTNRDGVTTEWPAEIVKAVCDGWPKGCVYERRAPFTYESPRWSVTVGSRTDAVAGLSIIEGKCRFGQADMEDYAESLQWRLYLCALPWAVRVVYRIHEIGGMYSDKETGELRISKNGIYLKGIHEFSMWRQPGLEEEVKEWIGRFVEWAQAKGLTQYMAPREWKSDDVGLEERSA